MAEARGIGDRVDLDDLAVPDRETQDEKQLSTPDPDESHGSVHERRSHSLCTSQELPGHGSRTTDFPWRACKDGWAIDSEHDVRVEYGEQRLEVPFSRGGG